MSQHYCCMGPVTSVHEQEFALVAAIKGGHIDVMKYLLAKDSSCLEWFLLVSAHSVHFNICGI
jgi:hypothetical protein